VAARLSVLLPPRSVVSMLRTWASTAANRVSYTMYHFITQTPHRGFWRSLSKKLQGPIKYTVIGVLVSTELLSMFDKKTNWLSSKPENDFWHIFKTKSSENALATHWCLTSINYEYAMIQMWKPFHSTHVLRAIFTCLNSDVQNQQCQSTGGKHNDNKIKSKW